MSRTQIVKLYTEAVATKGYTSIPNLILAKPTLLHKKIKLHHLGLLVYFLNLYNEPDKYPYPSYNKMSKTLNISISTLKKYLKELEEFKLIKRQQQREQDGERVKYNTTAQLKGTGNQTTNLYNLGPLIHKLIILSNK